MNVALLTVVGLTFVLLLFAWISMREGYANSPTTRKPTTFKPTTRKPTTFKPTTLKPTFKPTTLKPTFKPTTLKPTFKPTTLKPTFKPTTLKPTFKPTTLKPTFKPTPSPTPRPRLVRIDGKIYPVCKDPSKAGPLDANKRRWGFENNTQCVVPRLPKNRTIIKRGNNGTVSCHAYCSGDWSGGSRGLCRRAHDTATGKNIDCFTIRGKGAEVQCECDRKSKNRVFKDGNDGTMNCNSYCASNSAGGPKGKCVYALDLKDPRKRIKFDCGVVKGKGARVGCVCEPKSSPFTPAPKMSNSVSAGTKVIDGSYYKVCNNKAAASAPDNWGRRWGWENNASCVVPVNPRM